MSLRAIPVGWRIVAVCGVAIWLASSARADVIVLKNGRRITAVNVKDAVDKVTGETSAGTISLSASMVDHIERDATPGTNGAAAALRWDRPPSAGKTDTEHGASLDPAQLQRVRREAASGDAGATSRAAAMESATGALAFAQGNLDEALAHAERALSYQPSSVGLLLDVAYFRLRRSEYRSALDSLQRARKIAPDSADVAKLTGWAYYGLNRLAPAVEEWKRSQALHPDDDVAAALDKAERDLEAEREFREDGSEHFILKYDGASAPELAREILRQLESDYQTISATLDYSASEKIGILLYTNQAFADITRARSWVGALNDGRIRIPVQGLSSVTPELARVLRHELAHSLVGGKTRGRCPVWLQEGVAQWLDGTRITDGVASKLLGLYDRHEDPSLTMLESSWMKFESSLAANAYGWSLAAVESIATAGGPSDVEHLLDRVATDANTETAVRASLGYDYAGLSRSTADYLRRNFAR
jgi:tetratricopeptide (TPR) repeat protein